MDQPTPSTPVRPRRGLRIALLACCVVTLIGGAYFVQLTYSYYTGIESGTLDLRSFEQGGATSLTNAPQVTTIRSTAVERFSDDPSIGPADAAVTIVEFGDFQCPFCREVFPTVKSMLASHSVDVRFVYRDFPVSDRHPDAQKAAEAGQCAHEQGVFWSYHDKLYLNAEKLTVSDLKLYAQQLHLNTAQFDECLDSGKYTTEVLKDLQDGIEAGATGTPTFFFNGNRVAGVLTAEGFEQIIDYFTK